MNLFVAFRPQGPDRPYGRRRVAVLALALALGAAARAGTPAPAVAAPTVPAATAPGAETALPGFPALPQGRWRLGHAGAGRDGGQGHDSDGGVAGAPTGGADDERTLESCIDMGAALQEAILAHRGDGCTVSLRSARPHWYIVDVADCRGQAGTVLRYTVDVSGPGQFETTVSGADGGAVLRGVRIGQCDGPGAAAPPSPPPPASEPATMIDVSGRR